MYNRFVQYYDQLFPLQEKVVHYLSTHLVEDKILDIGCGTGSMAIALAKTGFNVVGIDNNQEMIIQANKKKNKKTVLFVQKGMLDINEENEFDSGYCIGNTLVHLNSLQEVEAFFKIVHQAFKKDGVLIIQIINYDRILDNKINALPIITRETVQMKRDYTLNNDKIIFKTTIQPTKSTPIIDQVALLALRQNDLIQLLKKANWDILSITDGFSDEEVHLDSYSIVVVAKRKD